MKTFQLPEGFRIELAAAEPDVVDPVAMAFDARGRMFVVEMSDYPLDPQPRGRIKLLEDRDGDGRFEHSSVFAGKLHMPTGVMAWKKGILVACAPDILYFEDTDGDGKSDVRETVLSGFAVTNPQLRVNGLLYGIDNWIYAAYPRVPTPVRYVKEFGDPGKPIHFPDHPETEAVDIRAADLRFQPDQGKLEAVAGNSQYGNAFDAWGNRFTVWNNDHLRHVVVQHPYLRRNPYLTSPDAMNSVSDHERACSLFQIAADPKYIHDSQVGRFTSASGICIYTGGAFPAAYDHASFTCDPVHNVVHSDRLVRDGPTFIARRRFEHSEFVASTDAWFRPVFTTIGPDGALYIVDYHREVVEHPEFVPQEMLEDVDFRPGELSGRIYRVVHEGAEAAPRPNLEDASSAELAEQLAHPNLWWRITAQRLLVDRRDQSVVGALKRLAKREASPLARLHALWTLEGLDALDAELVLRAMADKEPGIREHAIRLAEAHLSDPRIKTKLGLLANDADPKVELQAACTLGHLPGESTFRLLEEVLFRHAEDRWFQTAVLSSAAENSERWFRTVTHEKGFLETQSEGKRNLLHKIASIAGARQKDREISEILSVVESAEAGQTGWWRKAALDGLAEGLAQGSEARPSFFAAQNRLLRLLSDPAPEVREAALEVAAQVRLRSSQELEAALKNASITAKNENAGADERAQAVRVLGLDPSGGAAPLLADFLTPHQSERVQIAAVEALAHLRGPEAAPLFLERWKSYTGPVREAVLRALFSNKASLGTLLDAVESEQMQASSLDRTRRRQLLRYPDPEIQERARSLLGDASETDRRAVYEKYRPALRMAGDVQRGKEVFERVCSECHRIGERGVHVGPDLMAVVSRNREVLLTDILAPNDSIESGYVEYLIETTDGRTVTGLIAAESEELVTLRRAKGEEDTVPRNQIAGLRSLNVSAMPEDLEQDISIQGMADLLAYLKSL